MNQIRPKKILILSADTGGGHDAASLAVREALDLHYPGQTRVTIVNTFRKLAWWPANRLGDFHRFLGRPGLGHGMMAVIFHEEARPGPGQFVGLEFFYVLMVQRLRKFLMAHPDHLVVTAHPIVTQVAARVCGRLALTIPMVTLVTELARAPWTCFHPSAQRCLVGTTELAEQAQSAGVEAHRLRVTGLPVGSGFQPSASPASAHRADLGLPAELRLILLVGGAEGYGGPLAAIADSLARRLSDCHCQLVVVTGRNVALRAQLERTVFPIPLQTLGFVSDMHRWVRAADLVITKPGPGTLCEVMAVGRPLLLFGGFPGPEQVNVTYLRDRGVADYAAHPRELAEKAGFLLSEGTTNLGEMARQSGLTGAPGAARAVAQQLMTFPA